MSEISEPIFTFVQTDSLGNEKSPRFTVVQLRGTEAISELFKFEIVLMAAWRPSDSAAMQAVLNAERSTLYIWEAGAHKARSGETQMGTGRPYHGRLAELEYLHSSSRDEDAQHFYRAVLVPRLWALSVHRRSRVFVDKTQTVSSVVSKVLEAAVTVPFDVSGLRQASADPNATRYPKRAYLCQYQESSLDFLARWLERVGIYYYFEHEGAEGQGEQLILLDEAKAEKLARVPDTRQGAAVDLVARCAGTGTTSTAVDPREVQSLGRSMRPLFPDALPGLVFGVSQREFIHTDAGKAPQHATWPAEGATEPQLVEQLHGEGFLTEDEGKHYARIRAEALTCRGELFQGTSTVVGLRSGKRFQLEGHFMDDLNAIYLVTSIVHEGQQGDLVPAFAGSPYPREGAFYRNRFTAARMKVREDVDAPWQETGTQFRPLRNTPWPRIAGTMSAFIQSDKEPAPSTPGASKPAPKISPVDQDGCYWVRLPFHVDFDPSKPTSGSAPVRMAVPYAGNNHGLHFPLHEGDEVLLAFMGGDPDRPVIVGAVPNSFNKSVVTSNNNQHNLIRSAGGNAFLMDDAVDRQAVWIHSPALKTAVGLGEVGGARPDFVKQAEAGDQEAGDEDSKTGLLFVTDGGKRELVHKDEEKVFQGTKWELSLGSSAGFSAGFETKASIGASVGVSASNSIDWKLNLVPFSSLLKEGGFFQSLSIDDSESVEFTSKTSSKKALGSLTFSAGVPDADDEHLMLQLRLAGMRTLIAAYVAGNLALQAKYNKSFNSGIGVAAQPLTNTAFNLLLQAWGRSAAGTLEKPKGASYLSMDSVGVVLGAPDHSKAVPLRANGKPGWPVLEAGLTIKPATGVDVTGRNLRLTATANVQIKAAGTTRIQTRGATLSAGYGGKTQISFSNDAETVSLDTPSTSIKLEKGKLSATASDSLSFGQGKPIANPMIAALQAQVDAAEQLGQNAFDALDALKLQRDSAPTPESKLAFEPAVAAAHAAADQAFDIWSALTLKLATAQANPVLLPPVSRKLTIDSTATEIKHNLATIKASDQGVALEFAGVSLELNAQGLTGNGLLIKLG